MAAEINGTPTPNRADWLRRIRESETFGPSSCTTVSEANTDAELLETLQRYDTFVEAWRMLVACEEIHWNRCGMDWSPSENFTR
jgi:hypothetical protein